MSGYHLKLSSNPGTFEAGAASRLTCEEVAPAFSYWRKEPWATWVVGQQMWNGLWREWPMFFSQWAEFDLRVLGVINMAHGEVFMIGAMVVWTLISLWN
jgi:hypothetical protein